MEIEGYISEQSNLKNKNQDQKEIIDKLTSNNFLWKKDFQNYLDEAQDIKSQFQEKDNIINELKQKIDKNEDFFLEKKIQLEVIKVYIYILLANY